MADYSQTGKEEEEEEEEEEQEGKATDSSVDGTMSENVTQASQGASPKGTAGVSRTESAIATPQNASPLASKEALREPSSRRISNNERIPSLSPANNETAASITSVQNADSPSSTKTPSDRSRSRSVVTSGDMPELESEEKAESVEDVAKIKQHDKLKPSVKEHRSVSAQRPAVCGRLFERRSPFVHNPPAPEERRARIQQPRSPRDYIINLREDLADFQESHGLPRTRDYSFFSLGLSLAQETGRAIYAIFLMFTELFPIVAIVSLILRYSLDKMIEILETDGTVPRVKKSVVFVCQILIIMIPLWILIGTIVVPLFFLILSIFRRMFRLSNKRTRAQPPCPRKAKVARKTQ